MRSPRRGGAPGGAVVTGAGRGLGCQIALRLGRLGWFVHVTDADASLAADVAAEMRADGGAATSSGLDVRDPDACRHAAHTTVEEAGTLDLWINNAGVLRTGPVWSHTDAERRLLMEVNALGTMHGTIAALEIMRPHHSGHIINVASLAGLVSVPGEGVYAASKHAVLGFSTSALYDLRVEGERNIHISCVCPDGMWTPMLFDKLRDPGAAMSFSGTLFQPEEIADLVLKVVSRPTPVTTAPLWRGAQVRLFDLAPGFAAWASPWVMRLARRQQAAMARRLAPRL